jgi:hypothetical protein
MINHIYKSCGIDSLESSTIVYTDNIACVAWMQIGYIKSNIIKHIGSKLFYLHELYKSRRINILQVKSCDNLADLFRKSLPSLYSRNIFMESIFDGFRICKNQGEYLPGLLLLKASYYTLFPFMSLLSRFSSRFLMR